MSPKRYAIGDTVTLKVSMLRAAATNRVCEIVGLLPSDRGEAQYRVRLADEKNERRVVASDIDDLETDAPRLEPVASFSGKTDARWLLPSSVRVKK